VPRAPPHFGERACISWTARKPVREFFAHPLAIPLPARGCYPSPTPFLPASAKCVAAGIQPASARLFLKQSCKETTIMEVNDQSESNTRTINALAFLAEEHEKTMELFDSFEEAVEEDAGDELEDIAQEICDALEIHAELEEEIFYPAATEHAELVPLVNQAQQEHDELQALVDEVREANAGDAELQELVGHLRESVEAHVREEENVLFPQAEELMEEHLDELGARLRERREELSASRA
jgi:hemerythrin